MQPPKTEENETATKTEPAPCHNLKCPNLSIYQVNESIRILHPKKPGLQLPKLKRKQAPTSYRWWYFPSTMFDEVGNFQSASTRIRGKEKKSKSEQAFKNVHLNWSFSIISEIEKSDHKSLVTRILHTPTWHMHKENQNLNPSITSYSGRK